ncbi:hypothetical protein [Hymenobacter terrenus]|uniref:hypothetical protein n=1 Tax=Hymenobacter terrenus TaxID=1629124 RepID=UPI00061927D1|nr:hypothetical protein [Hymenobacter terrenus]
MNVELLPWYDRPDGEPYYNHKTITGINSLGTFNDVLRVPDLLLTALYRLDPKTGKLVKDVQLKFQPNGPSNCQLNFPHSSLASSHYPPGKDVYEFDLEMDVIFNAETVLSRTGKFGGNVEVDAKVAKVGADGSYEMGKQYPDERVTLHGRIHGRLNARSHAPELRLTATGFIFGSSSVQRTK